MLGRDLVRDLLVAEVPGHEGVDVAPGELGERLLDGAGVLDVEVDVDQLDVPPMPPRALSWLMASWLARIISSPSSAISPVTGKALPSRIGRRTERRRLGTVGAVGVPGRTSPPTIGGGVGSSSSVLRIPSSSRSKPAAPPGTGSRSRLSSTATAAAAARVRTSSLVSSRSTWVVTVRTLAHSRSATSAFDRPPASRVRTSSSRWVMPYGGVESSSQVSEVRAPAPPLRIVAKARLRSAARQ